MNPNNGNISGNGIGISNISARSLKNEGKKMNLNLTTLNHNSNSYNHNLINNNLAYTNNNTKFSATDFIASLGS